MNKQEKREYNRERYLKNRDEILAKARRRTEEKSTTRDKVVRLFPVDSEQTSEPKKPRRPSRREKGKFALEILALGILVLAMTYYLVSETAEFYQVADDGGVSGYFKAALGEGILLVFSFLKPPGSLRWVYRALVAVTCLFSLWAVSGAVIGRANAEYLTQQTATKTIQDLEAEIAKRSLIRDRYLELNRLTNATRYEIGLDQMRHDLAGVRRRIVQEQSAQVLINTVATLVFFRLIVLVANILLVHRLGEALRRTVYFRQRSATA